jgi:hypothetical protein
LDNAKTPQQNLAERAFTDLLQFHNVDYGYYTFQFNTQIDNESVPAKQNVKRGIDLLKILADKVVEQRFRNTVARVVAHCFAEL